MTHLTINFFKKLYEARRNFETPDSHLMTAFSDSEKIFSENDAGEWKIKDECQV